MAFKLTKSEDLRRSELQTELMAAREALDLKIEDQLPSEAE